jgi:hypothetical protein
MFLASPLKAPDTHENREMDKWLQGIGRSHPLVTAPSKPFHLPHQQLCSPLPFSLILGIYNKAGT